ncbi:helix-turn-helix domain-containing protein [Thetidibacter halocola]
MLDDEPYSPLQNNSDENESNNLTKTKRRFVGYARVSTRRQEQKGLKRLREEKGMGATEIARRLGIARTSVYRVLEGEQDASAAH